VLYVRRRRKFSPFLAAGTVGGRVASNRLGNGVGRRKYRAFDERGLRRRPRPGAGAGKSGEARCAATRPKWCRRPACRWHRRPAC